MTRTATFCPPNGEVEWVEGGGPVASTFEIPVTPTPAAATTEPGATLGVTLDGVAIENSAPVEFILGNYTIGAFDDCGGHVNPIDGCHRHATTGCSNATDEVPDGETAQFGYALDGYAIHPPYEVGVEPDADLDQCNGHETDGLDYHYHANQVAENQVLPCFSGEIAESEATGGGPGGGGPGGGQDGPPPGDG